MHIYIYIYHCSRQTWGFPARGLAGAAGASQARERSERSAGLRRGCRGCGGAVETVAGFCHGKTMGIYIGTHEKTWKKIENMGQPWENHGETWRKTWKNHGKK